MNQFKDQLGRLITLSKKPKRIISLVPSQTELLFYLGLDCEVVGVTKFCVHPREKVASIQKIGGTKNIKLSAIENLSPDLIIANKEENRKEDIAFLEKKYPVWVSDVKSLPDAFQMIESLGELTGRKNKALELTDKIKKKKSSLKRKTLGKAVYFIWKKPWMVAGKDTFINTMLEVAGFENVIEQERYPEVKLSDLKTLDIDYILLSSEPYPFKGKHVEELKDHFPISKIKLVNGEFFSWYGNRLLGVFDYFCAEFYNYHQVI